MTALAVVAVLVSAAFARAGEAAARGTAVGEVIPLRPAGQGGAGGEDARAAFVAAEARTYHLAADGISRFACRVTSPVVARLTEAGGRHEGGELSFTLWWESSGRTGVAVDAKGVELSREERDELVGFFSSVHQLVLPWPSSVRLSRHAWRWARSAVPGEVLVEAVAVDAEDERRLARFTVGANGLVVKEHSETRAGEVSDLRYRHVASGPRWLVAGCDGTFRGKHVSVDLEWGAEVSGRPVPTRLVVRQHEVTGVGAPRLVDEVEFILSGHRFDASITGPWPPPGA